ncbi:hypothetical protein GCM10017576_23440 [Microbacterium barkeri]|uniref:Uncharacterized protein n=1 Tax=Microbacterium barkeri TaxID=33917 RepID=A0A9W6LWW3_9MICO|nr:hypothetical protein [Microbacterium barkeri]MDI6944201.1 hypothetical protein [Microbacterium barkeri]MDR6876773.1 hypothetical protein [Microbacterium barkeri]GLJ62214.1 hypothetical protein GCM10017576_23440 [Microbacterium barkeri]
MEQQPLLGEKVGFHAFLEWERPDPCWGRCSYCAAGEYRYEDEEVAEKVLALLRKWSSICADAL